MSIVANPITKLVEGEPIPTDLIPFVDLDEPDIDKRTKKTPIENILSLANGAITLKAGEAIPDKGRAVKVENGKVFLLDKTDANNYNKCVGLSGNSAILDGDVLVINNSILKNIGILLVANDKYYVGDNVGQITNTPPALNLFIEVGYAINTSDIFVSIKPTGTRFGTTIKIKQFSITNINQGLKQFTVLGNTSPLLFSGKKFDVEDFEGGDGIYTVNGAPDAITISGSTIITVLENIPSGLLSEIAIINIFAEITHNLNSNPVSITVTENEEEIEVHKKMVDNNKVEIRSNVEVDGKVLINS